MSISSIFKNAHSTIYLDWLLIDQKKRNKESEMRTSEVLDLFIFFFFLQ